MALLLVAAVASAAGPAPAQPAAAAASQAEAAPAGAPIKFENRALFTFRARMGVFTPEERAAAATKRIRQIAEQRGPLAVTVEPLPEGNLVLLDGQRAFLIAQGDVDAASGETLAQLTDRTVKALEAAAAAYHESRSVEFMLKAAALAAVATALYLAFLRGLVAGYRRLSRRIAAAVEARIARLKREIVTALNPATLGHLAQSLLAILAWALALFATYVWLTYVLERFPYTRPWGLQLEGFLLDTLAGIALAIVDALPGLFVVVVIFVLARMASQVTRAFFDRIQAGRITVGFIDPDTATVTRRLVAAGLWIFAFAMAYPYLPGAQTEAFKGVSVLVGLMVSLGASSIVGQAASGLILTYSHAFRPGEYVRIGETEGTLTGIGLFATRIETGLGEHVTLPNSVVMASATRNYSRAVPGAGFVMDTTVTIGYATPWRQVHAMLAEAARRTEGIAAEPAPMVAQTALADFYVAYRLICYAEPRQPRKRAALLSALHANIQDVFNEYGVQIMSPHYMTDPAQAQVVPKAQWFAPPAAAPGDSGRAA
ncbi:MAG: mechanosensitive ion channel family protein [Burkholderiales bacterium]|nr:mechanosensitive ion channel family protein [Burkholderiales bacterium]